MTDRQTDGGTERERECAELVRAVVEAEACLPDISPILTTVSFYEGCGLGSGAVIDSVSLPSLLCTQH